MAGGAELTVASPPRATSTRLRDLGAALDDAVPARRVDRNLLIATWNVRAFGDVTPKWRSSAGDSPRRDLTDVALITEIVSRFDVVAIQEVKGASRGFRELMRRLGPSWGFLLTDVTRGSAGNQERMAFVFDRRRVTPSGLACELVEPERETRTAAGVTAAAVRRQFARTPYAVGFTAGALAFTLVTLHVIYGKAAAERVRELEGIARWLARWAAEKDDWAPNLIALGDFNIDRRDDALWRAFTSTGLRTPPALDRAPRTIFAGDDGGSFYDQIAWFTGQDGVPMLELGCTGAGYFDFAAGVDADDRQALSWRLSDHYPLWVEFSLRAAPEAPDVVSARRDPRRARA
jgi:endonuclease/exonuclease/phosphatase family metal-dependent hydrolase